MAQNEFLTQLSRKPPAYRAGVLLIMSGMIALIYYQLIYSDMVDEVQAEKNRRSGLIKTQSILDANLSERLQLLEEKKALDQEIEGIQLALPEEAELASFYDYLHKRASEAQVKIKKTDLKGEQKIGTYIKVPVKLTASGTYYQLVHYFQLMGPRAQSDDQLAVETDKKVNERMVTIENLSLAVEDVQQDGVILSASFQASTFRHENTSKVPGAAGAAKKQAPPAAPAGAAKDGAKGAQPAGIQRLTQPGAAAPKP